MGNDIQLTNNSNGKKFFFRGVEINDTISQQVISIPLVNTTPENTILFRFFGQTEFCDFSFALYDNGLDVSDGDSIITIDDQINYLKKTIYGDNFDVSWTLSDINERYFPSPGVNVVITNLKFSQPVGAGTVVNGTCTLQLGNIGAL